MVLLSAFRAVLSRYSGQRRLCLRYVLLAERGGGSVERLSGARQHAGARSACRARARWGGRDGVRGTHALSTHLAVRSRWWTSCRRHGTPPLTALQVTFVLKLPPQPDLNRLGLTAGPWDVDGGTSKFDLTRAA